MNLGDRIISKTVVWVEQRRVLNYLALLQSSSSPPPPPKHHSLYILGGSGRAGKTRLRSTLTSRITQRYSSEVMRGGSEWEAVS